MKKSNTAPKTYPVPEPHEIGGGPGSAGQSGDTQGLSDVQGAGSESIQELVEEGQYFEAEVLMGVEDADDVGVAEVHTRQLPPRFRDEEAPVEPEPR